MVWAVLLVLLASPSFGQCLGDFDNSGAVTVAELVTAVNNALRGCDDPTPRPTATRRPGCAFVFTDDIPTTACDYGGSYRAIGQGNACASGEATWESDGTFVRLRLALDPPAVFTARVIDATNADVDHFQQGLNPALIPSSGTLEIDGGRFILLRLSAIPFTLNETCRWREYSGEIR